MNDNDNRSIAPPHAVVAAALGLCACGLGDIPVAHRVSDGGSCSLSAEVCNGVDDDCNGAIDDGTTCRVDTVGCRREVRDSSTYQFCDAGLAWRDARDYCASIGYELVEIDDSGENEFVALVFGSAVSGTNGWIGLSDESAEMDWRWVDGTPDTVGAWEPGKPDDVVGDEDCALLSAATLGWSDHRCDTPEPFACEVQP